MRQECIFSGNVQGVGFRYTTKRIAMQHPVRGFVRNLPGGQVQLIAEGEPDAVRRFVAEVERTLQAHIEHTECHAVDAVEPFEEFEIRH